MNHAGFSVSKRSSAFLDLIGPVLERRGENGTEFAFELDERHVNARGTVHEGVLSTLADVALGRAAAFQRDPPAHLVTASMTIDFAGAASQGDVVIATVDVQKVGRRIAFANCYLSVGEKRIARASGVFANVFEG